MKKPWAKIITTPEGNDVLFYLENDSEHDDCHVIHCVTRHDGVDADMKVAGIPSSTVQAAFDGLGIEQAVVIYRAAEEMLGSEGF